jgi:hypothetical protein
MVRCLVIGVGVGGGTSTGAGTDGSEINLGANDPLGVATATEKVSSRHCVIGKMVRQWYTI